MVAVKGLHVLGSQRRANPAERPHPTSPFLAREPYGLVIADACPHRSPPSRPFRYLWHDARPICARPMWVVTEDEGLGLADDRVLAWHEVEVRRDQHAVPGQHAPHFRHRPALVEVQPTLIRDDDVEVVIVKGQRLGPTPDVVDLDR